MSQFYRSKPVAIFTCQERHFALLALANLSKNNVFYHDFNVAVAAGVKAGIGAASLPPVLDAMDDPLKSKSITLSCGKLTTGVTVRPWTGMLMLRKLSSPDGSRLATDETTPEQRVTELVGFLPVLAYDGSAMRQLDAAAILDIATSGTSATLLAKRWESVLLVNVDDSTLTRLMNDPKAMEALQAIGGFRNLNADLETIINRSEQIKDAKRKASEGEESDGNRKRELAEAEKERKSLRKQVQEKLIKFAARVPVFMYLTDFREQRLKDVITRIEPKLFSKLGKQRMKRGN
jgi:hypothetical protein